MESNYTKSARIKLERLGVKDDKDFRRHKVEIYKILENLLQQEYEKRMNESLLDCEPVNFTLSHNFVDWPTPNDPQPIKPWHVQPSRSPKRFIDDYFSKGAN